MDVIEIPATLNVSDVTITGELSVSSTTIGVGGLLPIIEGGVATLQEKSKSYTPTETAQSESVTADSGFDGLSEVNISVGAIPSDYVGSNIPRKDSSNLSASGDTVTAPAGYYASSASKAVQAGSATTPATTITANPSISVDSNGKITATVNKLQNVTPTVSAGYVSSGTSGAIGVTGSTSSQLSTQAGTTVNPTESEQTAVASGKYTTGAVKVGAISPTYIGSGITQRSSTDLSASGDTVSVPSGYYASNASKSVAAGTAGTPTASKVVDTTEALALITPSVTNTTGYITGGTKTGTAFYVTANELVSGNTLTADGSGSWTVDELETLVIPAGTAGTPSASKSISNHAATVTPSVTNSAGWISSGTKTGTAVNVSASELVSGTLDVSTNGQKDVTNYQYANVQVGGGAPTLQEKTKSYTPTESAQSEDVTADSGYDGLSKVSVSVGAISSSYVGSGITRRDSTSLSASGDTVSVPSGYYASNASKAVSSMTLPSSPASSSSGTSKATISRSTSTRYLNIPTGYNSTAQYYTIEAVANGTEGTPTATKGTVSNHSVSVTPSVTNTAGYISGGTKTGTAVSVSASELTSGNLAIMQNGTNINVANYSTVSVAVEGGGGGGLEVHTATSTPSSASTSISFTGLSGEPTSFYVISNSDLATGSPAKAAAVVFDGTNLIGQTITNTSNAQASYDGSGWSKSYSSGTLTITGAAYFQANQYTLVYTTGGNSANIGTSDVQVGSGATSITFTDLPDEPTCWGLVFKSDFATSSGYSRVISVVNDGSSIHGLEMASGASYASNWTASYSNGSLTITSSSTSAGGYFHQPGYYQLTYAIGGSIEIEIESLNVTENGTYQESGKAYSPVIVNVSGGGGASIDTKTVTASNRPSSLSFSSMKGEPKAWFLKATFTMTSSSSTYYYVDSMRYSGSGGNVQGRLFRMGSTRQTEHVTTGYSYTYSSGTLTVSSTGNRTTSPGCFYNGSYELVYVY